MDTYNFEAIKEETKNIQLLYVEDDEIVGAQVKQLLELIFSDISFATNGLEAKEIFDQQKIDIIITDIRMPQMDGLEFARYVKNSTPFVPVILLTAFTESELLLEAIKIGIDGYLTKPIKLETLFAQINKVLSSIQVKKENDALKVILNQYKEIVDESMIVSKTNEKGIITYTNDMFVNISGYTQEELIGSPHNIIRHPDMPKEAFKDMWATIKAKKTWRGKVKNRKKDGGYYIVKTTVKPILDQHGDLVEYIALRDDITELEDLREKLKNENDDISNMLEEYSNAINNATIVSRTNLDGIITYANERFAEVSGYSIDELVGSSHSIIKHPDTQKGLFQEMWQAIQSGKIWQGVIKNRKKNGQSYWVKSSIFPITDKTGKIIEYMSIRQDISKTILLHQELEDTQRELLYRMGDIAEKRSEETGHHVKRVAKYSKILAQHYGLSKEEIDLLYLASPMHDIGKVAISDAILKKESKLTSDEFEKMKKHSMIGYEVLKSSKRPIIKAASIVAREHHEKWDGTGYPQGKRGKDIHVFGRITAVADVFDALSTDRYYKKAWKLEEILKHMKEQSGKHFEPELIKILFDNLDEILTIKNQYQD
jgi:PAS domain S-box-containing protein